MIPVFLDTNVVLDLCLDRQPFVADAVQLFRAMEEKRIHAHLSATIITDIYYLASRQKEDLLVREFIAGLLEIVKVIGVNRSLLSQALLLNWDDFEDALQYAACKKASVSAIVTRNTKDFIKAEIPVYAPSDFLLKFCG